jgi:glycosyltransferase involved in cell wall biosynthesis
MKTLTIGAAPHSCDGSSYYRIWLPFTHLLKNSRHITGIHRPGSTAPTAEDVQGLDVMVFQRPAGPHGTRMLEGLLGHTRLVYEIDDDMLNVESAGLPHLYDERARESIRRCLRLCDMVTVSSPHLAEIIRPYNENTVVLPNHIKAGLLDINRPRRDRLTIGWAGGTTHSWDVEEVREPLRDITRANPDVDIHFIGANHSPVVGHPCRWTKWEQDVGHYYKHVDFDIAVAPSADNLFNRSKTWLRALEMGALGIPVVASNRLPYSDFVIDGKTGFLVNSPEEWRARLTDLINDPEMRAEMGAAGKEQAAGWTIEDGWKLWESAYETVAD